MIRRLFQRLFINRDYVFVRRYLIDKETNTLYIMSRSTEHPDFPKFSKNYRIEDYWSIMVIRPYSDMNKPGIQFSLTYFDNPGVNIPSSVANWITKSVMPDFLKRLRKAVLDYQKYCRKEDRNEKCLNLSPEEKLMEQKYKEKQIDTNLEVDNKKAIDMQDKIHNVKETQQFLVEKSESASSINEKSANLPGKSNSKSFWKYFHPFYYFY